MSRNGSGTYSLPVGNPVVTGTTISSTWANNTLTDIANALTGSLAADGQTTASGNLNMGTNKIVNLAEPTNPQDGATKYYIDTLVGTLGTMAYQDADAVDITGGDIININLDLRQMTNEIYLPVGPTALRTASPVNGLMRFNSDGGGFYEGYLNGTWQKFTTVNQGSYTISYLMIAGGGAGGCPAGVASSGNGGGGAGGMYASTLTAIPSTTFTMTIGAGGSGASASKGTNTVITGIATVYGGGAGAGANDTNGGSGGGGGGNGSGGGLPTVPSQGNAGGAGSAFWGSGGGGGGAGAAGAGGSSNGGDGGAGAVNTLLGTTNYYAGGGGGDHPIGGGTGGSGGIGGGGSGGSPGNGSANTGSGGGAARGGSGNGGSGVVILSMPTVNYTGTTTGIPLVSTVGSNTVLTYNNSGTYTA
jgi:hypothetical protein